MKHLKSILFLFCFGISSQIQAQYTDHFLLTVGYEYQNRNFAELGAKFLFLKKDETLYRIGGSALLGSENSNFKVLPKLQGEVLWNFSPFYDLKQPYYFLVGAEATPKFIAPKIGLSVLGIIDFTGGYGFTIGNSEPQYKGLNLGLTINIPLVMIQDLTRKTQK